MLLRAMLNRLIRHGRLTVQDAAGQVVHYGDGRGPQAAMALRSRRAARRLVLDPALAFGELYMEGELEPQGCTIYEVLDVVVLNHWALGTSHAMAALREAGRIARRRWDQLNRVDRSRRNVAHHYDLNGRLYALFLDRDRQYSCAYFRSPEDTLEQAQLAKKRHIAAKLHLDQPGLEVLDIGCGWGGMAITLAQEFGAHVTGITLSEEQLAVARQRAAEAGLADRVRFELMDYREWDRPVDRVVSVGMFEHVGISQYHAFFRTLRRALKPEGVALVHAIGRSLGPGATNPWLTKYIFPGGYSPALSEVVPAAEKSGLWLTDLEVLRLHYAETLRHWRRRFAANRDAIAALHDERFCRMFEFYLAGCELAFRRGDHMVWQVQLSAAKETLPLTRDYMQDAERAAAARAVTMA